MNVNVLAYMLDDAQQPAALIADIDGHQEVVHYLDGNDGPTDMLPLAPNSPESLSAKAGFTLLDTPITLTSLVRAEAGTQLHAELARRFESDDLGAAVRAKAAQSGT